MKHHWKFNCAIAALSTLQPFLVYGQSPDAGPDTEDWNAKFQATYVWQTKGPFAAAYSGPNSLISKKEKSYSFTAPGPAQSYVAPPWYF